MFLNPLNRHNKFGMIAVGLFVALVVLKILNIELNPLTNIALMVACFLLGLLASRDEVKRQMGEHILRQWDERMWAAIKDLFRR